MRIFNLAAYCYEGLRWVKTIIQVSYINYKPNTPTGAYRSLEVSENAFSGHLPKTNNGKLNAFL